ncbi:uncharacterized protein LOC105162266 [Sesamum indicum]|uniref:Uncharacterized protein LOC105162266 n=1 Tax=Sesamum indicum TaxID=4182 RepID=A0A6I9T8J1_SESIN|nr:uncharacterized protein LOC105162266 [Sesamum indicum]
MRSHWMLTSLLLLSVLVPEAQGMRLRKDPSPLDNKQQKINEFLQRRITSGDGVEEGFLCKGKHCSGRIRKLIMASISTTPTTAKNDKDKAHTKTEGFSANKKLAKKDKNLSRNLSAVTEQRQPNPDNYPDTLDIAGMDYSQARRKPPIHN